jgi:hypothetical protein
MSFQLFGPYLCATCSFCCTESFAEMEVWQMVFLETCNIFAGVPVGMRKPQGSVFLSKSLPVHSFPAASLLLVKNQAQSKTQKSMVLITFPIEMAIIGCRFHFQTHLYHPLIKFQFLDC